MTEILTAASIIGAVVLGVTQLIKNQIPNNKWLPVINVIAGIFIGLIYSMSINGSGDLAVYGWAGALSGLAAGGFYDLGAGFVKGGE